MHPRTAERIYRMFLVFLPASFVVAAGIAGILALLDVPVLGVRLSFSDNGVEVAAVDAAGPAAGLVIPGEYLRAIGAVALEKDDLLRYPEFVRPREEQRWRNRQAAIYRELRADRPIPLRLASAAGEERTVWVQSRSGSLADVLRRGFPIYLSGLILAGMSVLLYSYSRDVQHRTSQVFFVALGSYHMLTAAMTMREVAMNPRLERFIIAAAYVAAGACIALIHFTLVFPRRKAFLETHPRLIWIPYAYFGGTAVLYLADVIAFGSTYLCLSFWALVAVVATFHGYFSEKDLLLKQQVLLFLMIPVLMAVFFSLYIVMPGVLRTNTFEYSNFAILSIAAAFSMALAVENRRIYLESLEKEHGNLRDRLQMVREMHDNFGNVLTGIIRMSAPPDEPDRPGGSAGRTLPQIRNAAQNCLAELRDFIAAVDPASALWKDYAEQCRRQAADYLEPFRIALAFRSSIDAACEILRPPVRYHLTGIIREALGNVAKHAGARHVAMVLDVRPAKGGLVIEDDGGGFAGPPAAAGSHGLVHMEARAKELGGRLQVFSSGNGTRLEIEFIP